jgi:hypothetical protein
MATPCFHGGISPLHELQNLKQCGYLLRTKYKSSIRYLDHQQELWDEYETNQNHSILTHTVNPYFGLLPIETAKFRKNSKYNLLGTSAQLDRVNTWKTQQPYFHLVPEHVSATVTSEQWPLKPYYPCNTTMISPGTQHDSQFIIEYPLQNSSATNKLCFQFTDPYVYETSSSQDLNFPSKIQWNVHQIALASCDKQKSIRFGISIIYVPSLNDQVSIPPFSFEQQIENSDSIRIDLSVELISTSSEVSIKLDLFRKHGNENIAERLELGRIDNNKTIVTLALAWEPVSHRVTAIVRDISDAPLFQLQFLPLEGLPKVHAPHSDHSKDFSSIPISQKPVEKGNFYFGISCGLSIETPEVDVPAKTCFINFTFKELSLQLPSTNDFKKQYLQEILPLSEQSIAEQQQVHYTEESTVLSNTFSNTLSNTLTFELQSVTALEIMKSLMKACLSHPKYLPADWRHYFTFPEIIKLCTYLSQQYPSRCRKLNCATTPKTYLNVADISITAYEVGILGYKNTKNSTPQPSPLPYFLLIGGLRARERGSINGPLAYFTWLCISNDPLAKFLRRTTRLIYLPVADPASLVRDDAFTVWDSVKKSYINVPGHFIRKNSNFQNLFADDTTSSNPSKNNTLKNIYGEEETGVDLNRNFGAHQDPFQIQSRLVSDFKNGVIPPLTLKGNWGVLPIGKLDPESSTFPSSKEPLSPAYAGPAKSQSTMNKLFGNTDESLGGNTELEVQVIQRLCMEYRILMALVFQGTGNRLVHPHFPQTPSYLESIKKKLQIQEQVQLSTVSETDKTIYIRFCKALVQHTELVPYQEYELDDGDCLSWIHTQGQWNLVRKNPQLGTLSFGIELGSTFYPSFEEMGELVMISLQVILNAHRISVNL